MAHKFIILIAIIGLVKPVELAARTYNIQLYRTYGDNEDNLPDISYYTEIDIGSKPQSFKVQFDLMFDRIFVPHFERFKINPYLHFKDGFRCSMSKSCKKTGINRRTAFRGGNIDARILEDNLSIMVETPSGRSPKKFAQLFMAAEKCDKDFSMLPIDGVIGLGPLKSHDKQTLMDSLYAAKLIDNLQFSMWFNPNLDSGYGGQLVLGGVDTSRYTGDISWHHTRSNDVWSLSMDAVAIGSRVIGCQGSSCHASFSSGSSFIYGPNKIVNEIQKLLAANVRNGIAYVNCNQKTIGPEITFVLEQRQYRLPASNYIGQSDKKQQCFLRIVPSNNGDASGLWVLGTSFLSAYYTAFDVTNGYIGIGALRT